MYIGTTEIQIRTLTDVDLFSQFRWLLYKVANVGLWTLVCQGLLRQYSNIKLNLDRNSVNSVVKILVNV
jgi:hypothetical protein